MSYRDVRASCRADGISEPDGWQPDYDCGGMCFPVPCD